MTVLDTVRLGALAVRERARAAGRERFNGVAPAWAAAVDRDGVCVVENFLSPAECAALAGEIDRLQRDYPAAVRVASNGADRRIFGAEKGSRAIARFAAQPQLLAMARQRLGGTAENAFTLAGAIAAAPGNLGSGEGWHRDALFGQFKALLYLTDVSAESGPLEYVHGSHLLGRKFSDHRRFGLPLGATRIADSHIEHIARAEPGRIVGVTGAAGTLVLIDATGIHRGRPLVSGSRAALTNYYYRRAEITEDTFTHFKPVLGHHIAVQPC